MESPHLSPKRTLLVVDGSYLLISSAKMKLNINYTKLVQELERKLGCEFYEKWFVNGEGNSLNYLYNALRAAPPAGPQFRVKLLGLKTHTSFCKHCKRDVESKVQKGVDVSIATLILKHAFKNLYDQVVLIAGDGDFHDALATVKDELGKDLVLVGFQDSTVSLDLQQIATKVVWLNSMADLIREGPAGPQNRQQQMIQQPAQQNPFHHHPPPQHQPLPHPQQQQVQQPQPQQQPMSAEQALQQLRNMMTHNPQQQQQQQQQPLPSQQPQPQSPKPQQPQHKAPEQGWTCSQCTYFNAPSCRECEMCASVRPISSSPNTSTQIHSSIPLPTTTQVTQNPTNIPKPVPTLVPAPLVNNAPSLYPTPSVPHHYINTSPQQQQQYHQQQQPQQQQYYQIQQQLQQQQQQQQQHHHQLQQQLQQPPQQPQPQQQSFKLPVVTQSDSEKNAFPCPVCTFHRMSNITCEMCGYNTKIN